MVSINGTVAEQAQGTIMIHSECKLLDSASVKSNQLSYWLSPDEALIAAGYNIRMDPVSFALPYF